MEEALLSGSLVNKRLNLRACIVGKSLETAVVKTYRLIQSGFLSQHSATMQLSPNVAASNTAPNALVVKTFWSKPLIYRERHTKKGPNRRRRVIAPVEPADPLVTLPPEPRRTPVAALLSMVPRLVTDHAKPLAP